MIPMREVTLEEVRRVAELANLELTAAEEPGMRRDLSAILQHIAQLDELDTTSVEPMTQGGDVLVIDQSRSDSSRSINEGNGQSGHSLRADAVRASLDRRAVMASAPETDGRFFKVPKVIER